MKEAIEDVGRQVVHELDRYLQSRRSMVSREQPILQSTRPPVYYRKGSVVTYATADLLGHARYASTLRGILEAFPDPPPYPSVLAYRDTLLSHTPDSLREMIQSWHTQVVLYDLTARQARPAHDTLQLTVEARKVVVEGDSERAVSFYEPVDVGLFAGDSLVAVRRIWIRDGTHTYSLPSVPEGIKRVEVDPFFERINRRWEERGVDVRF